MANPVSAFGVPIPPGAANAAASSPSLNALPAPAQPQSEPDDSDRLLRSYRQLLYAAMQLRKLEKDPDRLSEIERIAQFSVTAVEQHEEGARTVGPPVPSMVAPPPPPPPMPAGGPPNPGMAGPPNSPGAAAPVPR